MKAAAAPKSPLLVTAIQLGLLVFGIYYTFIGGQTAQGIYDHRWRLITLWLMAGLVGLWLGWRWLSRQKIPRTPLDGPLLFLLITWLLATVFSVNRTFSQEALVFFITYLFFYYIAVDLGRRPWFVELTFNALIGVSGLVWTLALWQLARWYQDLPAAPALLQRLEGPLQPLPRLSVLGNPNTMASFLALLVPVVLYKLNSSRLLVSRLLLSLWLALLTGAILLTQSRGGLLALMVGVGFFGLVWVVHRTGLNLGSLRTAPQARAGLWLVGAVLVLIFSLLAWLTFSQRSLTAGVDVRQEVMAGAIKSLSRHPILGAGPGALGEELVRYQRPLSIIWSDAHNLPLTLIAETGLLGGLGLLWLVAATAKLLWSTLWQTDPARWRLSSLACAAALLGFAAHNLVDSLFKFPLIMLPVAIWAGFWVSAYVLGPEESQKSATVPAPSAATSMKKSKRRDGSPPRRFATPLLSIWERGLGGESYFQQGKTWNGWMLAVAFILLAGATITGLRGVRNIEAYNQAVEAAARQDWPAARERLAEAIRLAPAVPFYHRQMGLVSGYLAGQDPAYRQEAISHYQSALAGQDQLAIDHANLACLLWEKEQQAEAIEALRQARTLEPGNPVYRLNLGRYLELSGDLEAARAEYAWVLARWPDTVRSSFWQQTPGRTESLPAMIEEAAGILAEAGSYPILVELYLSAGDAEAAWQVAKVYAPELARPHLAKGRILAALGRPAEARAEFEAALELEPRLGGAYLGLSQIALTEDKVAAALQYAEAALFLERTATTLAQIAEVSAVSGNGGPAIEAYDEAFTRLTSYTEFNLPRYATEVARRRPLPVSHLPCLQWIYPTPRLVNITLAEGALLESQGNYPRVAQVYQRLLQYEPTSSAGREKLTGLCQNHPDLCENLDR